MKKETEKPRRTWGLKSAGEVASRVTRPIIGRHGFAEADLIARWPFIVGAKLAENCIPLRIAYSGSQRAEGTLHIKVENGSLAMELQHMLPQLIERVNAHFGFKAGARAVLAQGPLPRSGKAKKKSEPEAETDLVKLAAMTENVTDPELKAVLMRLGRYVVKKEPSS
jgi:hypothetical protein